jgi:hypothetical protein
MIMMGLFIIFMVLMIFIYVDSSMIKAMEGPLWAKLIVIIFPIILEIILLSWIAVWTFYS